MAGDSTVFDLARSLLDVVVAYYAAHGVSIPDRQYVSNGLEAIDCESVIVHCLRTFPIGGDATEERVVRIRPFTRRGGEFGVSIFRCVPTVSDRGVPPTEAAIEASALEILTDPETMALAVISGHNNGDLPGCGGVGILGWDSYGPEGGYGGGTQRVAVVLD